MEIAVFGARKFPSNQAADASITAIHKYSKHHISVYDGKGTFLRTFKNLYHALRVVEFDLVHVHHTDEAWVVPLLRLRYKVILTSHGRPYQVSKWGKLARIYFKISEWIGMRTAHVVTSVSKPQKDSFQSRYKRRVYYVPNGVEKEKVDLVKAQIYLKVCGIRGDFILFTMGRFIEGKGTELIRLVKLHSKIPILTVKDMTDRATLLGLMKLAKVVLLPSYEEAMSMVMLEAAYQGTPIIASDLESNKYVLRENAAYFKTGEWVDLFNRLTNVLDNYKSYKKKAKRLRHTIISSITGKEW